jgi:hypothetical protein
MKIGYGEIEKQTEKEIIKKIVKKFEDEENVNVIRDELEGMVKEAIREAVKYDSMSDEEAPERYCVFYAHVFPVDTHDWLIQLIFYHTNRRFPLSTDRHMVFISKKYIYRDFVGNIEILQPLEDYLEEYQGVKND